MRPSSSARVRALTAGAVVLLLGGLATVALLGFWFVIDQGYNGNGSALVSPGRAIAALTLAGAGLLLLVWVVARTRSVLTDPALFGRRAALCVAGLALLGAGYVAYPRSGTATITALDPSGRTLWHTRVPATYLTGIISETQTEVTIEGEVWQRGCTWYPMAISINRATGAVDAVSRLATFYPDPSSVPAQPQPPNPSEFRFRDGRHIVRCSS